MYTCKMQCKVTQAFSKRPGKHFKAKFVTHMIFNNMKIMWICLSVCLCRTPRSWGFMFLKILVWFISAMPSIATRRCFRSLMPSCQRDGAEGEDLFSFSLILLFYFLVVKECHRGSRISNSMSTPWKYLIPLSILWGKNRVITKQRLEQCKQ